MDNVMQHPSTPPPPDPRELAVPQSEAQIRKDVAAMRLFFDGLVSAYPNAALHGRQDSWRKAAHGFIDMIGDA